MANKKRRYKKRNTRNTRNAKHTRAGSNSDFSVIALMLFSVLLAVLTYTKSGIIGVQLNKLLGGIIGIIQYVLPIGLFIISIMQATGKNEKDELSTKLIQYCAGIICLAIAFSAFQISAGELNENEEINQVVQDSYNFGIQDKGGGVAGAIGAVAFVKLFGIVGAIAFSICLSIAMLILAFGINPVEIVNNILDKIEDKKQEKFEREQEIENEQENEDEIEKTETPAQRRKRQRQERKVQQELAKMEKNNSNEPLENQIKINFGGRVLNDENEKPKLKKYDHSNDDIDLIGSSKNKKDDLPKKETIEPDVIENNLFKDVEEQKEEKKKAVLQLEHAQIVEDEHYEYPPVELLSKPSKKTLKGGAKALTETATKLQKTLYSFGVAAKVENVSVGPAITRYELKPAEGVKVSKIVNLADDIALNLAAKTIRIEAPIPGKQAVGIEVPNKEREVVHFREILESKEFKENDSKLTIGLGKDVAGNIQLADIAKMPHVLIAGSTGSGKSVCINTIVTSIIYNAKPSEVKFVMIDPKVVELSSYNGIPHLLIPVVTDPRKAAGALAWAVQEMEDRYEKFASKGVRDLKGYNKAIEREDEMGKLPQIVIIIDELADLMMVAKNDVEDAICRLAQKARAAGMHLVIATQRPSVDVITGLIKANIPSRIAFAVSSQVDSRTILDSSGAEKLLRKGDMLFQAGEAPKPIRIQGAFISDEEVEKVVDFIKSNGTATYSEDILESIENNNKTDKQLSDDQVEDDDGTDPLLDKAIQLVVENGQASTSFIQRTLKVGYPRAGRIIDQMEERGIISGYKGSKPREVLMTLERLNELKMGTEPKEE